MGSKVMVVSYNSIDGCPRGRYEKGKAIAYSAEWGFERFADLSMMAVVTGVPVYNADIMGEQQKAAEAAFFGLEEMIIHDLPQVEVVYIYVGVTAMEAAMIFIKKLQALQKKVCMIACDCDQVRKIDFARQLGLTITWTWCGGEKKCGEIFAQYAL